MRALYSLLFALLLPLALLLLHCRRWDPTQATSRGRWRERFGGLVPISGTVEVWVHAASVGEVLAAAPLVNALLQRFGDGRVAVTTLTATGSTQVQRIWGARVHHAFLPFDLPFAVARFLDHLRPRRVVIMETELWPNLYAAIRGRRIPLLIANARLSPRSMVRYARVRGLVSQTLACCSCVAAQSQADAKRFEQLGAPRVVDAGNLKFDLQLPQAQVALGRALRAQVGTDRPVWVAASTHQGEEETAIAVHRELLRRAPDSVLILVPRHPPRFDRVWTLIEASGLTCARRSAGGFTPEDRVQVLLGDSLGEMFMYLAASDAAFVGGSLVPVGGHNVLEPAALGLPVLFGPHMHNFVVARELLLDARAAQTVTDEDSMSRALIEWLGRPDQARAIGASGAAALAPHRGATLRLMELIEALPVDET